MISERVLNVSKRDDYGRKEGICFQYDTEGKITRVSEWNEDKEVCLIKQFIGNQMIEYKNGVKRYEGGFVDSLKMNYKRHGNGIVYDKNGKTMIYRGDFSVGRRHGKGISYHHRKVKYEGEWLYGVTKRCFYTINVIIIILGLMVVIGVCMFNLCAGIILLILLLLCLGVYISYLRWSKIITIRSKLDYKIAQIENNPRLNIAKISFELTQAFNISLILQSVEIGNDCFGSVQTFKIEGLERLKSVKIGNNSFTQLKSSDKWDGSKANNKSRSFHILDCDSLESIQIGEFSFCDFGGEFELSNLKSLKSIQIGTIGSDSSNFFWSSFVIRGIDMMLIIE